MIEENKENIICFIETDDYPSVNTVSLLKKAISLNATIIIDDISSLFAKKQYSDHYKNFVKLHYSNCDIKYHNYDIKYLSDYVDKSYIINLFRLLSKISYGNAKSSTNQPYYWEDIKMSELVKPVLQLVNENLFRVDVCICSKQYANRYLLGKKYNLNNVKYIMVDYIYGVLNFNITMDTNYIGMQLSKAKKEYIEKLELIVGGHGKLEDNIMLYLWCKL